MAEWTGQSPKKGKRGRDRSLSRGVTLIEVMLAAAIFALMVMALFEGIAVSARIARENAEYLQADAYAFDLAWKLYNEGYEELQKHLGERTETLQESVAKEVVPMLNREGSPVVLRTRIISISVPNPIGTTSNGILISVDVEWGLPESRRRRSGTGNESVADYKKWVTVFKSENDK